MTASLNIRKITRQEAKTFQTEGLAFLSKLVDQDSAAALLSAADQRAKTPGNNSSEMAKTGRFFDDHYMFNEVPIFGEFMRSKVMGTNAALAMQANTVRAYFDHLFVCEPATPVDYYWHQDLPYWPIDGEQICSFWLALTPCTRESSALLFVSNTVTNNKLYRQSNFGDGDDDLEATQQDHKSHDVTAEKPPQFHEIFKEDIVSWAFEPGDAALFNARTVHSSGGNRSTTNRRVAYSSRWIGEDTTFRIKPGYQDEALFPDKDESISEGAPLTSRRFPVVWTRKKCG